MTKRRGRRRDREASGSGTTAAPEESGRWLVARQVGQFHAVGVLALVLVGLGTAVASRRVGEREAIVDARTTALAKAQGAVEPAVTDGLLTARPDAVRAVADVVTRDVLDRDLVRVKIWTASGRIVYSDEPRLAGATYPLASDERDAIAQGTIQADVSDDLGGVAYTLAGAARSDDATLEPAKLFDQSARTVRASISSLRAKRGPTSC